MRKHRRLQDVYHFPGYRPNAAIQGIFGDPHSVVIKLVRLQKKRYVGVVEPHTVRFMTEKCAEYGICHAEINAYTWKLKRGGYIARSAGW